jgi:competence ComEA-like helix-hairpin-helix protein
MTDQVNPNTASAEELASLPGVGPALVARIIAARPFDSLEDLQQVRGIGAKLFKRLESSLTLEPLVEQIVESDEVILLPENMPDPPASDDDPLAYDDILAPPLSEPAEDTPIPPWDDAETAGADEFEGEPEGEAIQQSRQVSIVPYENGKIKPKKEPEPPKPVSRTEVTVIAFFSGLIAFVLAVALSLGILAAANGSLRYATPGQLAALNRQIDGIDLQADLLADDLVSLQGSLDLMAADMGVLDTEVSDIAGQIDEISTEVDAITAQVEALSGQTEELSGQVGELQGQVSVFQAFMDGLRSLLNNISVP